MDERMGKKLLYAAITFAAYAVFAWAFFRYHKISSEWFGINILVYTAIVVILVMAGVLRLDWFRERVRSAPGQMFAIAAAGFLVCLALGVFFTEPYEGEGIPPEYSYSSSRTGEQVVYIIGDLWGSGSSGSSGDVDFDLGDDSGEAVAILLLVVLVVALAFGSAIIPHFWVIACAVLVAVMGLLAYREVLLKEGRRDVFAYP